MKKSTGNRPFIFPLLIMAIFLSMSLLMYRKTGRTFFLFDLPYIGSSITIGIVMRGILPSGRKQAGRRVSQLLIGLYMLLFLGFYMKTNMQIEGFFFYAFLGAFGGAMVHYSIAKIAGTVILNRGWCSYGCWTAMVLDYLPWKKPVNGRIRYMGLLRYLHFIISISLVAFLFLLYRHIPSREGGEIILWVLAGNIFYYSAGIIMAALMKDNRAFCKYLCPIPVLQKALTRFSVFKMRVIGERCTRCMICEKNCPMDISLISYSDEGRRILSTECILCLSCMDSCPHQAIEFSPGLDCGFRERVRYR